MVNYHDMKAYSSPAFSLTELLCVVAIIGILSAVGAPAFHYLSRGQDPWAQATLLRAYLQEVRTTARTKGTWVQVGFHERTGQDGRTETVVAAISSISGEPATETNVTDDGQWPLLGRPLVLRKVRLDINIELKAFPSFARRIGETVIHFDRIVEVSPSGLIQARSESLDRLVITLLPDAGKSPPALLQLYGAAGIMRVLRPAS